MRDFTLLAPGFLACIFSFCLLNIQSLASKHPQTPSKSKLKEKKKKQNKTIFGSSSPLLLYLFLFSHTQIIKNN
jgi:hypothetical protein